MAILDFISTHYIALIGWTLAIVFFIMSRRKIIILALSLCVLSVFVYVFFIGEKHNANGSDLGRMVFIPEGT